MTPPIQVDDDFFDSIGGTPIKVDDDLFDQIGAEAPANVPTPYSPDLNFSSLDSKEFNDFQNRIGSTEELPTVPDYQPGGAIRHATLSEEYPGAFDYLFKGPLIAAGGAAGTTVGGIGGTLAGGALGAMTGDAATQMIDQSYDRLMGREPVDLKSTLTADNAIQGAVGGVAGRATEGALNFLKSPASVVGADGTTEFIPPFASSNADSFSIGQGLKDVGSTLEDAASVGRVRMMGGNTKKAFAQKDWSNLAEGERPEAMIKSHMRTIEEDGGVPLIAWSKDGLANKLYKRATILDAEKKAEIQSLDSVLEQTGQKIQRFDPEDFSNALREDLAKEFVDSKIGNSADVVTSDVMKALGPGPYNATQLDQAKSFLYGAANFKDPNATVMNRAYITAARILKNTVGDLYDSVMGKSVQTGQGTLYGVDSGTNRLSDILRKQSAYIEMGKLAGSQADNADAYGLLRGELRQTLGGLGKGGIIGGAAGALMGRPGAGSAVGAGLSQVFQSTVGRSGISSLTSGVGGMLKGAGTMLPGAQSLALQGAQAAAPYAASGAAAQMMNVPELQSDGRPQGISLGITPSFQPEENPGNIPRHIGVVDPRMLGSLISQYASPNDVVPLAIQGSKVFASGDLKEKAKFLGALSEKYPDMPFSKGPITGMPSEFQMEDGSTKLFSPTDQQKWAQEIENSPLREDEKAQRMRALYTDGTVYPLDRKLNNFGPPVMADDSMESKVNPQSLATRNMMSTYSFKPRQQTPFGSAKME